MFDATRDEDQVGHEGEKGFEVDHIDHNTQNNHRDNLRLITKEMNQLLKKKN